MKATIDAKVLRRGLGAIPTEQFNTAITSLWHALADEPKIENVVVLDADTYDYMTNMLRHAYELLRECDNGQYVKNVLAVEVERGDGASLLDDLTDFFSE